MGTLGPKYLIYGYLDPLGYSGLRGFLVQSILEFSRLRGPFVSVHSCRTPRGSSYSAIMEFGPNNHTIHGFSILIIPRVSEGTPTGRNDLRFGNQSNAGD